MTQALARIFVRFNFEGWHCWPDAPDHRAYLRDTHRHMFHAEVACLVAHDDREIEFHDLRDESLRLVKALSKGANAGSGSCEKIARDLGARLVKKYGRAFSVTISEDGECGATVDTRGPETKQAGA